MNLNDIGFMLKRLYRKQVNINMKKKKYIFFNKKYSSLKW